LNSLSIVSCQAFVIAVLTSWFFNTQFSSYFVFSKYSVQSLPAHMTCFRFPQSLQTKGSYSMLCKLCSWQ